MGFFDDWAHKTYSLITDPSGFFKKMKTEGGYDEPLQFAIFNIIIWAALGFVQRQYFPIEMFEEVYKNNYFFNQGEAIFVTYSIIIAIVSLYLISGIDHLFLRILCAKKNYEATFRVYAYMTVFNIVIGGMYLFGPVGVAVGLITAFGINFTKALGYRTVHKISYFRALLAVFMIPILMIAIISVLIAFIIIIAMLT